MFRSKGHFEINPPVPPTTKKNLRNTENITMYCVLLSYMRESLRRRRKVGIETVQDFLIKLDIKPLMHLLKISIFKLNNDLVRLTKIMNNLVKDLKILSFKVIFQCLKLVKSFQKKNLNNFWLVDQLILMKFLKTLIFKVLYLLKMCPIFVGSVHNFGKSADDII